MITLMLCAPVVLGAQANTVEIRGEIQNFTTQPGDIVFTPFNFAGFWYDIDDNLGTESLTIKNCSLSGTQRTIPEDALVYSTSPMFQYYELYEDMGLTVESDNSGGDQGYYMEGWLAEDYVCLDGNADELVKLLVEFEDDDKKTLSMGEEWILGGGFVLTAQQIDLEGDKVIFQLTKDGKELDVEVVSTGGRQQDRVYTYTADTGGEEDIPVLSLYVSAVFRGTDTNIVQVEYVFLMDNEVVEIDTSDEYGEMEVRTASKSEVVLTNDDNTVDLDADSKEHIMGNMYFVIADNDDEDTVLRFYPMVELTGDMLDCPEIPDCPDCPEVNATVNQTPCPPCEPEIITVTEYVNVTVPEGNVTTVPDYPVKDNTFPGFAAVFAIVGLFAVVYIVVYIVGKIHR